MTRRTNSSVITAAILPLFLLSACGGGGTGGGADTPTSAPTPSTPRLAEVDAARLAQQASFGPTSSLISHIAAADLDTWLNEQFAATGSSYVDLYGLATASGHCTTNGVTDHDCYANYFTSQPVAMRFYADAVSQPDQLRQRVAFALAELLVTSDTEVYSAAGAAAYNQIFLDNAFGNYRDVLKAVTLNPYMGSFLDMGNSSRVAANENYAREFLQLFTIGPVQLNADGTPKLDASGATIANYGPDDIKGVARALTGWTFDRLAGASISDNTQIDYTKPMIMVPARYDTDAKTFLGTTVPAGTDQNASVQAVVDAAFNNSSMPPYVAKFLIQKLVTDNPSAAYVGRVAAVFANDGAGTRGNLKAVVKAILSDTEARGAVRTDANAGKVKEPALLMTSLVRAIGATTDGFAFNMRDKALGQHVFSPPSVFNFYPPDYPLAQSATLVSPASKLMTAGYIMQRHNLVWDWTIDNVGRYEFKVLSNIPGSTGTTFNWADWQATAADVDALLDRLNLVMLAGTMTSAQRGALRQALLAVTSGDPQTQASKRAALGLYVVAASPQFQVDR